MRSTLKEEFTVTGDLSGEKIGMKIDENSLAHIMSIMTDLYSDPEMAVIREYSTNALDSHIEAGNPMPIEITLPTPLAPFFKVKDYGIGLNRDDIADIYSKYGASTKRETDDQVGMLGLGCKSALTYSQQFVLVGIKDGQKTKVSVSREEDGTGSMTVLEQTKTHESNGVEILIPCKNARSMEEKANNFFRFWKPGTVLVNGEQPDHIDGLWVEDGKLLLTQDVDQNYVVMGNVAYPMDGSGDDDSSERRYSYGRYSRYAGDHYLVAFVDIGQVHFTPSRESLHFTKRTKDTIADIKEREPKLRDKALGKLLAEAKTRHDAVLLAIEMGNLFAESAYYKGEEIPRVINDSVNENLFSVSSKTLYGRRDWNAVKGIQRHAWAKCVIFEGMTDSDMSPVKCQKLYQWATKNGIESSGGFFVFNKIASEDRKWLDPSLIYDWETGPGAEKLPKKEIKTMGGRITGSYDIWKGDDPSEPKYHRKQYGIPADDFKNTKTILYVKGGHGTWDREINVRNRIPIIRHKYEKNWIVVDLPANRVNKFVRDFPKAKNIWDAAREIHAEWEKSVAKIDREAYAAQEEFPVNYYGNGKWLKALDPSKVDDPRIKKLIKLLNHDTKPIRTQAAMFAGVCDTRFELSDENLTDDYPLIDGAGEANVDHAVLYMNAVYAARKKDGK